MKPIDPHALITIQRNPYYFLYIEGDTMPTPAEVLKHVLEAIKQGTIEQLLYGWDYPSNAELVARDIRRTEPKANLHTRGYFKGAYSKFRYYNQ